ncbi:hypothetical protein P154DRAFT_531309 [Amniculicola lignicola CBS 123094]|uniref:Uncharacterized protein n=1 Tax=Amniculicola lignicola CBS 123094 TaxID=1392246 RepID=A0A6A5WX66_9PLEO|nr:hypothetical protein P154DRAFT_531309 [Amniculicola lignicola CBS 123094]
MNNPLTRCLPQRKRGKKVSTVGLKKALAARAEASPQSRSTQAGVGDNTRPGIGGSGETNGTPCTDRLSTSLLGSSSRVPAKTPVTPPTTPLVDHKKAATLGMGKLKVPLLQAPSPPGEGKGKKAAKASSKSPLHVLDKNTLGSANETTRTPTRQNTFLKGQHMLATSLPYSSPSGSRGQQDVALSPSRASENLILVESGGDSDSLSDRVAHFAMPKLRKQKEASVKEYGGGHNVFLDVDLHQSDPQEPSKSIKRNQPCTIAGRPSGSTSQGYIAGDGKLGKRSAKSKYGKPTVPDLQDFIIDDGEDDYSEDSFSDSEEESDQASFVPTFSLSNELDNLKIDMVEWPSRGSPTRSNMKQETADLRINKKSFGNASGLRRKRSRAPSPEAFPQDATLPLKRHCETRHIIDSEDEH